MIESALFVFGLALLAMAVRLHVRRGPVPRCVARQCSSGALDASAIAREIQRVREDYVAQVQARQLDSSSHQRLLAAAREAVRCLPFVAMRRSVPEAAFANQSAAASERNV